MQEIELQLYLGVSKCSRAMLKCQDEMGLKLLCVEESDGKLFFS